MDSKTASVSVTDSESTVTSRRSIVLGGLVLLVPILVYGWVFSRYAINIPKFEDHTLKAFLLNLEKAGSVHEWVYEFFRQHNEHRIVYDRIITWLDYNLTGKLNYIHLMVVGNLSLVLLLAVFVRALQKTGAAVWMALPVALLLFNLSQWENMFWAMASLQNFTVVALALATFYALAFKNRVGWTAIGLAVVATITSGNGLLIWPVGLMLLFLRQDYAGVMRWLAALAVSFRLYFLYYEKPPGNPVDSGTLLQKFHGWLLFNGAAAEALPFQNFLLSCTVLGAVLLGVTALLSILFLKQHLFGPKLSGWQIFFLGTAAFVVGSGLVVALNRVGFGLATLTTSRYKIYSLTLLSLLFTYWISQSRPSQRRIRAGLASGFSFLLAFFSYTTYLDESVYLRKYLTTSQFNWSYTQPTPVSTVDAQTRKLINNAPAFYDASVSRLYQIPQSLPTARLDTVFKANDEYVARLDSFPVLGIRDEGAYLVARSPRRTYLFATRQNLSGSRRRWLQPRHTFGPGFTAQIPENELDAGTYDLLLLAIKPGNEWQFYSTGRQVTASGQTATPFKKNW
ncbi:hypothetical protein LX87_01950 [Larkinella arboricola]|uniref:Dolichyl-phosphate-mannose-protein mannosyltransferase n=1 Tax=Larkinella arboricola TaxID=643671 RepID=A0A327X2A0_LARAB|nr:hypothetical protein [Larkinella arboricola]RAK00250.1 hypothetical protein LX87_01950 [Larkinella arboricola]